MKWHTDPNKPAYPIEGKADGLTKRELFAAMAMQGHLASDTRQGILTETIVSWSVGVADALIEALNQEDE